MRAQYYCLTAFQQPEVSPQRQAFLRLPGMVGQAEDEILEASQSIRIIIYLVNYNVIYILRFSKKTDRLLIIQYNERLLYAYLI